MINTTMVNYYKIMRNSYYTLYFFFLYCQKNTKGTCAED